jgi:chemotaxis protein MotB
MRNRKKPEPPEEEGSPAWMNTYGDMVTLLLTFFVLLFAFSTIDAQKWEEIVSSLSGTPFVAIQALDPGDVKADEQPLDETSWDLPEPTPQPSTVNGMNVEEVKERFNELYEKIKVHVQQNGLEKDLNVIMEDEAILIHMTDSALFDSGRDQIKENAKIILTDLCAIFVQYDDLIRTVRVEGHTDNVPIQNAKFEDNWMLSLSRAHKVVKYMLSVMDVDPAKMDPHGYGEYHPVDVNTTEEGKARNRRVDFVLESILKD